MANQGWAATGTTVECWRLRAQPSSLPLPCSVYPCFRLRGSVLSVAASVSYCFCVCSLPPSAYLSLPVLSLSLFLYLCSVSHPPPPPLSCRNPVSQNSRQPCGAHLQLIRPWAQLTSGSGPASLEKDMYIGWHFPGETDLFPLVS